MTVEIGVTGTAEQRRDFAFKSPESLRPRTFLFDLNEEITVEGDSGPGKNAAEDEGKVDVGVSDWLE
ncbi:hypothetical protein EYF80_037700 [Liparis tanakae]|uniref:Uncharacterized protein n=1 Tax=Liparis tanakae TaxID=230148 RepID=A0A4Z2GHE7_9TELE|nr:hypothetical protein EYF80_037700 [Liparis tanakae]